MAVNIQQMIAASPTTVTGVENLNFNPGEETTSMDAKGGMFWDDEDDPSGVPSYNIWEE